MNQVIILLKVVFGLICKLVIEFIKSREKISIKSFNRLIKSFLTPKITTKSEKY